MNFNSIQYLLLKELIGFSKYELNVSLKEMWITHTQNPLELQEIFVTKEQCPF